MNLKWIWIQFLKLKTPQRSMILIGDLVNSTEEYENHYYVFKRKPVRKPMLPLKQKPTYISSETKVAKPKNKRSGNEGVGLC